ncbi:MAG: sodium:solute symporter family protein [Planctomycetes bacterium]|nr:sodium:solute symporter family protein [Planctomycetota bacterium]
MTHFDAWIDGSIVGLYLLATVIAGLMVRRHVGKVEHFLVAGREMDVHLGIASLAATEFGIITCMYTAQGGYTKGFVGALPGILQAVAMLVVGLTGFCIGPLRRSGVVTIPELFEKRFGPRIRWLSGLVIVVGGLLNMGIFLRVGGQFLVAVVGFDASWLELVMSALLVLVLVYTVLGGMLSVLVTDFLQFVVMSAGLLVVTFLILDDVGWARLVETVEKRQGPGGFNPLAEGGPGWSFVLFQSCVQIAATLTWQPVIARLFAAKDEHVGRRIYTRTSVFFAARFVIPGLWGIAAAAMLSDADLAALPAGTDGSLLAMPTYLARVVPIGMVGLLVAAMLAADMSTDSSYMLTWGGVIYNDLVAPFRKGPWSEKRGLFWNRTIVVLIGIFLLFFGLWYPLEGDVWTYCTLTGSIYLSSMSILLVACCYWKRANSWGAAAAIVLGAGMPIVTLVLDKVDVEHAFFLTRLSPNWNGFLAYALAAGGMIVGSLLKPSKAVSA